MQVRSLSFLETSVRWKTGKPIEGIEYEAHREMAEHQLRKIAQEAAARFDLLMIKLHHCVGFVAVGETSLLLRVAAAHRGPRSKRAGGPSMN